MFQFTQMRITISKARQKIVENRIFLLLKKYDIFQSVPNKNAKFSQFLRRKVKKIYSII